MPVDYSKSKIYKIELLDNESPVYVGSTTKLLCIRIAQHRCHYKNWKIGKTNCITVFKLFDKFGIDGCRITLIENYPCTSKEELNAREAHWIKELDCVNKYIPGRSEKEWYQDNKEIQHEKQKVYRETNKDKMKEKRKTLNIQILCECGKEYSLSNKTRHMKSRGHSEKMTK